MSAGLTWQSGAMRSQALSSSPLNKTQEKRTDDSLRFQIELEFVQSLANPHYLHFLAQNGHFKDQKLVNYLSYLQYWKEPHYAKYLKFPQCLHILDLLQYEVFRKELVNPQCAKFIDDQQLLHWQHYQRKRTRLLNGQQEKQQQLQGQASQTNTSQTNSTLPSVPASNGK